MLHLLVRCAIIVLANLISLFFHFFRPIMIISVTPFDPKRGVILFSHVL